MGGRGGGGDGGRKDRRKRVDVEANGEGEMEEGMDAEWRERGGGRDGRGGDGGEGMAEGVLGEIENERWREETSAEMRERDGEGG